MGLKEGFITLESIRNILLSQAIILLSKPGECLVITLGQVEQGECTSLTAFYWMLSVYCPIYSIHSSEFGASGILVASIFQPIVHEVV